MLKKLSGLHRLSVIFVSFIGVFVIIQSSTFLSIYVSVDSTNQFYSEDVSTRMHRKHAILKRGCSMVKTLFDMSQNGTSFEILLKWHQRIENISYSLPKFDENDCHPPLTEVVIGMHKIHTENSR